MTVETLHEHEARYLPYFQTDYRRRSLEALAARYVTGRQVLDMRCLTGRLAVGLAERGFDMTALDAFDRGVEVTNDLARSRGIQEDIAQEWDFTNLVGRVGRDRFDTVLCLDTLNHVKDDEQTIADIVTVLRAGGRLIVTAPAFPGLHGKRDAALGHLRRYRKASLRKLLERQGLEIESIHFWNFAALPAYAIIEGMLKRRLPERLRYPRRKPSETQVNRMLRWWYMTVENRLWFPVGLSLFVLAHKRQ